MSAWKNVRSGTGSGHAAGSWVTCDTETQGTQRIDHLAHEVAYEHWHRMLFAADSLAESSLLIEPDSGVAITMD